MRVVVVETTTGKVVGDLRFSEPPGWGFGLNQAGAWEAAVSLADVDKTYLWSLLDFWRYSWAVASGNQVLQCGPAIAASYTDDTSATLRVTGAGIWALFNAKRLAVNPSWTSATSVTTPAADINLGPFSLHTIAKQLVVGDLSRPGHSLPIVTPANITGIDTRWYPGYELAPVGQRLQELTQVEQGPEVEFRPEWTDSTQTAIQWRMRIGNPYLGQLGYPHAFDYGRGLTQVDVELDGSALVTAHFTKGEGTDRAMLYGYAEDVSLVNAGWPALEDADSDHTSASDQNTLNGWATGHLNTYGSQVQIHAITMRMDGTDGQGKATGSPTLDLISAGDNATLNIRGHRLLPDGQIGVRILGIEAGPDINTAKLTVQEIR